jgi:hypothetical protein
MHRIRKVFFGLSSSFTLVVASAAGAAWAKSGGSGNQWTMAGITTCPVTLRLQLSTPLTVSPTTAATTVTLSSSVLAGCTNRQQGNVKLVKGYLTAPTGSLDVGTTCQSFLSGLTAPDVEGGSVKWTPKGKIAASTALSFPQGSLSSSANHLVLGYTGGTVVGSFATTSAILNATSKDDVATLLELCGSGLSVIAFTGSVSL